MILPAGVAPEARLLLVGRALRAVADGYVAILLPAYLLALGLGQWQVGLVSTATLLGSALATLAVGAWGHRFAQRRLLLAAALLMAATGLLLAGCSDFWPLLVVAFVGTMNPSSGDVSVFLPLEHARLAEAAHGDARTVLFSRYTFIGALCAATGALAAGVPDWLTSLGVDRLDAMRGMFVVYGLTGLVIWLLYRRLPEPPAHERTTPPTPLGPSRGIVIRLAALFSSMPSRAGWWSIRCWRCGCSTASACRSPPPAHSSSGPACSRPARNWPRPGGPTHRPDQHHGVHPYSGQHQPDPGGAGARLEWALALLLLRSALSQMDVPTRSAFVMAVVTPAERAAAASFTAVPRSLAAAASPTLGGMLFASGWLAAPLVACGVLKIVYDLAIWRAFRLVRPR